MTQTERHDAEAKSCPDDSTSPTQEQGAFPTLCGPGCSCDVPVKNGPWKIVIMLIVIAVAVTSMIYKGIV